MIFMDTYLVMIGIFAVFLAISAVIGIRDKKRLDARERRRLRENFGKPGAKEYQDGRYEQIPGYQKRHRQSFEIDDITWNDLDMDLLYHRMDTTCSAAGEEYLYWLLRSPRTDGGTYLSEEGMRWWADHEQERVGVQRILQGLGRSSKYSALKTEGSPQIFRLFFFPRFPLGSCSSVLRSGSYVCSEASHLTWSPISAPKER